MASKGTLKRISRIRRRASREVLEAYEAGSISAKRADLLLYLPPDQRNAELERRLTEVRTREARNRLVADAIRGYLDSLNGQQVDLNTLGQTIREALVFAKKEKTQQS